MKELEFSVESIKDLIAAVNQNQIEKVKIKQGDFSIEIKGKSPVQVIAAPAPTIQPAVNTVAGAAISPAPESAPAPCNDNVITAPIVGTFYESPSPDKAPYIKVGDKVNKGDVLFIIESMKLMNEVTCECAGTVSEILVKNAEPVEYGQPILIVE